MRGAITHTGMVDDLARYWTGIFSTGGDMFGLAGRTSNSILLYDVLNRYNEPQRRYHDVYHLWDVVTKLWGLCNDELVNAPREKLQAVWLAAWYHDAIYDPLRSDNEERSAQLAQHAAAVVASKQIGSDAASYIRATQGHQKRWEGEDEVCLYLMDVDLSGLGEDSYTKNGLLIREEYAHLSDDEWREGRKKFLESFLGREHIFHTEKFRASHEDKARENMEAELGAI